MNTPDDPPPYDTTPAEEEKETPESILDSEVEVSWDGPDDPENPLNFSTRQRWVLTSFCSLAALGVTFASSAPTAATVQIQERFHVEAVVTYLIISVFMAGFVFGPIVWGPLSELLGRKPVLIGTLLAYSLLIIGQAVAPNIQILLITRFFSGFFSSSPLANAGGVIADIWPTSHRAPAMSLFTASVSLGPVMGPLIGGAIVQSHTSWRWIFWVMLICGMVTTIAVTLVMPETYGPVLLAHKAKRLRQTTSIAYFAPLERQDWSLSGLAHRTIYKPFKMLFQEPILLLMTIYISLVNGLLYAQFEAFPMIFVTVRGFNSIEVGLVFFGVGLGSILGCVLNIYWNRNYPELAKEWRGHPPPEARLDGGMVAAPLLVIGIFWLGWAGAYASVPWYVPALATGVLGLAIGLVFISFLTYIVDTYGINAASALAANTMIRSIVGASFPLFIVPMYTKMGIQWGSTLFGCLAILLLPSPFLFKKYGAKIRHKSAYAPGLDLEIAKLIQREKEAAASTPQSV